MAEYAPKALQDLFAEVDRVIPNAQFGGITGNANHVYGYHRSRNWILSAGKYGRGDYSLKYGEDWKGDGDAAAAVDITFPNNLIMRQVSARLMVAMKRNDPAIRTVREFFGTLNGQVVTGWDRHDPGYTADDSYTSADSSHLWHIHLSFYRQYSQTSKLVLPVAGIMTGRTISVPPQKPSKPSTGGNSKILPMHGKAVPTFIKKGSGHYLGLISGPAKSHGGFNASERPVIKLLQQQLIAMGFVPGVTNINSSWADGRFEGATAAAVTRFQKKFMPNTTYFGQVWYDDWARLSRF